jgi:hypothetical protein
VKECVGGADLFDLMIRNSYYLKDYVEEVEITPHTAHNDLIQKSATVFVLAQRNTFLWLPLQP